MAVNGIRITQANKKIKDTIEIAKIIQRGNPIDCSNPIKKSVAFSIGIYYLLQIVSLPSNTAETEGVTNLKACNQKKLINIIRLSPYMQDTCKIMGFLKNKKRFIISDSYINTRMERGRGQEQKKVFM